MKKYSLEFVGFDGWDRAVYKCKNTGRWFCDVDLKNPYDKNANIHTKSGGFDSEPDYPIKKENYDFAVNYLFGGLS